MIRVYELPQDHDRDTKIAVSWGACALPASSGGAASNGYNARSEEPLADLESRSLNPEEIRLYQRLAEVLIPSEAAIVAEQLAVATTVRHDDQHVSLYVPPSVRRLQLAYSQAMTGSYDDDDGWPIDIILHAAYGQLESCERYRTDAEPLRNTGIPEPSAIRLEPSGDQVQASSD